MTNRKLSTLSTLTVIFSAVNIAMILISTLFQKPFGHLFNTIPNLPFVFPYIEFCFGVFSLIFAIILKVISKKDKPMVGAIVLAAIYVFVNSAASYTGIIQTTVLNKYGSLYIASAGTLTRIIDTLCSPFSYTAYALFYITAGMCLITSKPVKSLATIDSILFAFSFMAIVLITIFQKSIKKIFYNADYLPFAIPYTALFSAAICIVFALILMHAAKTQNPKRTALITTISYFIYALFFIRIINILSSINLGQFMGEDILAAYGSLETISAAFNPVPIVALPLFYFTAGVYFSDNLEK